VHITVAVMINTKVRPITAVFEDSSSNTRSQLQVRQRMLLPTHAQTDGQPWNIVPAAAPVPMDRGISTAVYYATARLLFSKQVIAQGMARR